MLGPPADVEADFLAKVKPIQSPGLACEMPYTFLRDLGGQDGRLAQEDDAR